MTSFLIIFGLSLFCLCCFLAWVAWPVKVKKVDTRKRDAEIERLLDFDVTDKIYD